MKTPRRTNTMEKVKAWPKPYVAPATGLGDRVHSVLGPAAVKFVPWWPCLKGDGTAALKPKSLCNYLRQTANRIKL
jgi:hypothetical protein